MILKKKQTQGKGIESLLQFLKDKENISSAFAKKNKFWKPVLLINDIVVKKVFCKKCVPQTTYFLHAPGFPSVQVPQNIIDDYETKFTKMVHSHAMQRMVETFVSFEDYIIERCINEAIFFLSG
jgi:hypothetical protein